MKTLRYFLTILMVCAIALAHAQTPVAYYPFNGNANDAVGSNNGSVNGATLTTDRFGNPNSAYSFDGVDDFISVPSGTFTAYTITAWVKFSGSNSLVGIVTFTETFGGWSHQIGTIGSGQFYHYLYTTSNRGFAQSGTTSTNQDIWYHVTITASANGQMRLYVNGVPDAIPVSITGGPWVGGTRFDFGAGRGGFSWLNGAIDEVKIFNTQLTDSEVLADFNGTMPPPVQDCPIAFYPFTTNAEDVIGDNDGTVNSAQLTNDRFGTPNAAYQFDGGSSITMSTPTFTAYTLSAWVKFTGSSSANQNVSLMTAGNPFLGTSHQIRTDASGRFVHYTFDGTPKAVVGTTVASLNEWYFITITAENGGSMRLYVNGEEEGSAQNIGNLWTGGNEFQFGVAAPGAVSLANAERLVGAVDEFKVFDVALSADEVQKLKDEGLQRFQAPDELIVSTDVGTCSATVVDFGSPTLTGADISNFTFINDAPAIFPLGTTFITWTLLEDECVKATAIQRITVRDGVPPSITAPAALNISTREDGCDAVDVALGQPTVSDNCGIASVTNDAPETYPLGTTTVTWTVTDNSGNTATATQTVTVTDTELPTINTPAALNISTRENACDAVDVALGQATVSDNCGIASVTNDAPESYPLGTTTVTWTVTDNSGNTATATQTVTVADTELPTISSPVALNISTREDGCDAVDVALGQPTVSDNCGVASVTNNAPETYPLGTTTVTWTVTDNSGNTATATQTVTVTDTELPTITAPAALNISTRENACDAVDVALGQATVSDNCGIASVTNDAPETYPFGTTTVTWTVTDNNGNVSTATQTVTVVDEQDPLVNAPADVTIQIAPDADSATGVSLGGAQASDNCGVASVTNNAPTTFPIGTTVVTWTATDNSGNTATATQNVTVTREVLPTITAPAAINVDTDAGDCFATLADLGTPSVTGEDIPADGISNDAPETFPVGTTTVTWTVRDGNGNTATASQQVTVTDRQAPFIIGLSDLVIPADQGDCFAADVSLGEFEAGDNCSDVQVSNDAPAVFSVGVHTVTWTVTDAAGNKGGTVQRVTVQDREDPVVTAPADVTIQIAPDADSATGVSLGEAQVSDNCGIQSLTNDAPNEFPIGLTVVTWTATDNSGNTATAQQRVNVTREELPTIKAPSDITTDAGEGECFAEGLSLGSPTFTGTGASVFSDAPDQFPVGVTTVTWTVTDANGNTATAVQKVTVADRQAPQITAPGNITVSEGEGGDSPAIDLGNAVATDNCGIASIENDAPAVFPVGMTVVKWTATDVNGNKSTALQVVTVDAVTPVCTIQIKTKQQITVVLNKNGKGRLTTGMVDDGTASNCGPVVLKLSECEFSCADIGEQKITFTAVDAVGTKASTEVTIRVVDQTKPKVTVPQQPYVKVIRRGDRFVMPDLRNRVTASDNCGFELHQCPEPGKVFRKAHNGWIEFEAKDPSGNVGKGKMRFRLLVVGCRKPGKNGREELEGSESLITVPWNTSLPKIASDYVYFEEGSDMELAQQIKWSISDFDPLKPGFYQMEGSLPAEYLEEGDNGPAISLPVLVLNKPLPVDIFAAKDRVSHKVRTGEILTGLHTVDPADDIHSYSMDEHPDVYLENNVLVWRGNHMPEARTTVTVHSTDRAGQTISRQITLYRETDRPTDLHIYPNPAMQETNLMVQIPEGANVSIRIFDAAGRLVYQEEGQHELSFTRKIDLRHFAQGMYQVIVQVDRETLQGRIIKQ